MRGDWSQRLSERLPPEQQTPRGFVRALFLPIHTHLFVLAFLLFWYFQRQYVASMHHVVVAGALMSGIFVCLRVAILPWLGNLHKAALAASILCIFLLFFNDLRKALNEIFQVLHFPLTGRLRYDLPLLSLLFGAAIAWVVRTRRPLARVSQALDGSSFVLACMVATQILIFKPLPQQNSRTPELRNLSQIPVSTKASAGHLPDNSGFPHQFRRPRTLLEIR